MTKRMKFVLLATIVGACAGISKSAPGSTAQGTILPNGWRVTPSGAVSALGTLPLHMAEDRSGRWLAVTNAGYGAQEITIVDEKTGSARGLSTKSLFFGLAWMPNGNEIFAGGGASGIVDFAVTGGAPLDCAKTTCSGVANWHDPAAHPWISGLALSADAKTLYAADGGSNTLFAIDVASGTQRWAATVGEQPYGVVLSVDGKLAYVSNWAGGSVSVVGTARGSVIQTIPICRHPNAELARPDGRAVYVACADENVVADVETLGNRLRMKIDAALFDNAPEGATPNGLALSSDGATLFVADADENAVTAVNVAIDLPPVPGIGIMRPRPHVYGAIPAGWYVTDVAVSRDGSQLFILDGKGLSGHANPNFPHIDTVAHAGRSDYVASLATGDLERLPYPSMDKLAAGLAQARLNAAYRPLSAFMIRLPPIRHVIYVIKENRTYDEVLGDDPRGNGDAKLAIFGRRITPNIHRLSDDFVLLDNFYTDSEVSADGHNWATAAYATDYVQKLWPSEYSDRGRAYDFEEQGPATPAGGYVWDDAIKHGLSVRDYGEFVKSDQPLPQTAAVPGLVGRVAPAFKGFDLTVSDQSRVDAWLAEFRGYVARGNLPALEIVRLPNDHTAATRPGRRTPFAMVADNDYALGRMVDALSHSKYWKDTLLFVTEDDAQAGPDHVSDQRAEALVIGAWIKRGFVDHTHYTMAGMLRTMEVLLGIPPMSQFDGGGRLMFADFAPAMNARPWTASRPRVDLRAMNPASAPGASESSELNLTRADAADPAAVNSILYEFARLHPPTPDNRERSQPMIGTSLLRRAR